MDSNIEAIKNSLEYISNIYKLENKWSLMKSQIIKKRF
jgi:hypothetical protein